MKSFLKEMYAGLVSFITLVSGILTVLFIFVTIFGDFDSLKAIAWSGGIFVVSAYLVYKNPQARAWSLTHVITGLFN